MKDYEECKKGLEGNIDIVECCKNVLEAEEGKDELSEEEWSDVLSVLADNLFRPVGGPIKTDSSQWHYMGKAGKVDKYKICLKYYVYKGTCEIMAQIKCLIEATIRSPTQAIRVFTVTQWYSYVIPKGGTEPTGERESHSASS